MTGYGKAEAALGNGVLTLEIRTLNGKGADINIKSQLLPKDKEMAVRQLLADRLVRGTIDLYISWQPSEGEDARALNVPLLNSYLSSLEGLLAERTGLQADSLRDPAVQSELLASALRLPDVVDAQKGEVITEGNWPLVQAALDETLAQVDAFRSREGAVLEADVTSRVKTILELEDQVEGLEGERVALVREKLGKALDELGRKVDPSRFEEEMIYYLEKYDITEEKVRLRQHCRYFLDIISTDPAPGKKLGFIIQEMGREINTTGSKANHAGIQRLVVKMKDELEKVREQSMNIL